MSRSSKRKANINTTEIALSSTSTSDSDHTMTESVTKDRKRKTTASTPVAPADDEDEVEEEQPKKRGKTGTKKVPTKRGQKAAAAAVEEEEQPQEKALNKKGESAAASSSSVASLPMAITCLIDDHIKGAVSGGGMFHGVFALYGPLLGASPSAIGVDGCQQLANKIKENKSITSVTVATHQIRDEGVKALAAVLPSLPALTLLNISENEITPVGIQALATVLRECKKLTRLCLNDNPIGLNGLRSILEACNQRFLLGLQIRGIELGDEGAKYLGQVLPSLQSLRELDLSKNNLTDVGGQALLIPFQESTSLTLIILTMNKFSATGMEAIQGAIDANPRPKGQCHVLLLPSLSPSEREFS